MALVKNTVLIDTTFDFRTDTPPGKDPDSFSPTLRSYHKRLWSKNLPSGRAFDLSDDMPLQYLYHKSHLGEFYLSSDGSVPSFSRSREPIVQEISKEDFDSFNTIGCTIGNFVIFPRNQIDNKWTINQARGCDAKIRDRFDLTIECIRRHYLGKSNPLDTTLQRYSDFFRLFVDFKGYIDFFLLQDIVATNYTSVNFFLPFDEFSSSPIPDSVISYKAYRERAMKFIQARNDRIHQWVQASITEQK